MHIGLVTPAWPADTAANGIVTAVAHLAEGMAEIGHVVTIIAITGEARDTPRVLTLPDPRPWTLMEKLSYRIGRDIASVPVRADRIARAVNRAVSENGIELLVMEETRGVVGLVCPQVQIPVVVTLHGPWIFNPEASGPNKATFANRDRLKREGEALRRCAGITAPSEGVLQDVLTHYRISGKPTAVVPNPMPANTEAAPELPPTNRILFVGRFDWIKGGDTVLEAFARIHAAHPEAELSIAGPDVGLDRADGPPLKIDEALVALPAPVRSQITYLGRLETPEIEALRQSHGIVLVASRHETFGYTAVEALACGRAVVSTAAGGLAEIIRDGETGLLVPPEDPEAMADACLRLIETPALAAQLGQAAQADVAARFAPRQVASQMVDFLETLLTRQAWAAR